MLSIRMRRVGSKKRVHYRVVVTEGRNTAGPGYPLLETRGFVVKINRLFRL